MVKEWDDDAFAKLDELDLSEVVRSSVQNVVHEPRPVDSLLIASHCPTKRLATNAHRHFRLTPISMRANCGECSQPRRSPQPSPFTHLALKTEAAEARNHAVLAANAWAHIFHSCCRGSTRERPTTHIDAQLAVSEHACPIHGHSDHLVSFRTTREALWCRRENRRNTDRPPTHPLPPTYSSMQLKEGIRQFTTLLAATGSSSVDTDEAGKEVTEAEASRKAVESEAERLRRHTAAVNRSFAVHMEKRRAALTMCSTPMRRVSSLTSSVDSTPHTSLFLMQ